MIRHTRIPAVECICEATKVDGTPCLHKWVSINRKLPEFCPARDCRSREWNGKKTRVVKPKVRIELPKPVRVRTQDDEQF